MIQRIQTVYLFLAALVNAAVLFLPFATISWGAYQAKLWAFELVPSAAALELQSFGVWPIGLLALGVATLNLVTIFLYKKRLLQNRLNTLAMLLMLGVGGLAFYYAWQIGSVYSAEVVYGYAFVLPPTAMVLTYMAMRGITKDEQLVRSLDRIR